jgi:hypothetical protein
MAPHHFPTALLKKKGGGAAVIYRYFFKPIYRTFTAKVSKFYTYGATISKDVPLPGHC